MIQHWTEQKKIIFALVEFIGTWFHITAKEKKMGGNVQNMEFQYVKVEEIHFSLIMDVMNNIKKWKKDTNIYWLAIIYQMS